MRPPDPTTGPFRWKVVYDASLQDDDSYGQLRPTSLEIAIRPATPDLERETFHHELLHACCFTAGIKDGQKFDEENWISRISPLYLATIRDHPALAAYLFTDR